jgi:hypothetical protein
MASGCGLQHASFIYLFLWHSPVCAGDQIAEQICPEAGSNLLHNLDDVLILQNMLLANLLRPVLHGCAPHQGILELLDDALMYSVAEVFHLQD